MVLGLLVGFPDATVGNIVGVELGACVGIDVMVAGLSVMVVTITPPTPRGESVGASVGSSEPLFSFPGFESAGFDLLLGGPFPFSFPPPPPPFPATITPTTTPIAAKSRTMKGTQSRRLRFLSQKVQCVFTVPSSSFSLLLLP